MEFDDLLTQDAHDEGAECQIIHPIDGPTDFYIKVMGVDSRAYQVEQRKLRNAAIKAISKKEAISEEEEISSEIESLVAITIGWRGIESNGADKPFTKEACKELYTKSAGIFNQVDRFVSDRTNFIKG